MKNFYGNVRDKNDEFPWKNDQSWDARGSQNLNSIFFVGGGPYIYIHVVMSWDVLSVGVFTAD